MELPKAMSDRSPLEMSVAVGCAAHRTGDTLGIVEVTFSIANLSDVAASHAFVAFSMIGLRVKPLASWTKECIVLNTGRRMVRFAMEPGRDLGPGGAATPCALLLPVSMAGGGSVSVLPGQEVTFARLDDISLHYVIGAGNFPSCRTVLTVPADAVRQEIARAFPWWQSRCAA